MKYILYAMISAFLIGNKVNLDEISKNKFEKLCGLNCMRKIDKAVKLYDSVETQACREFAMEYKMSQEQLQDKIDDSMMGKFQEMFDDSGVRNTSSPLIGQYTGGQKGR